MFAENNYICANIIRYVHLMIIVFIILSPFHQNIDMVRLHIFVSLYIIIGWVLSSWDPSLDVDNGKRYGRCGLTELESKLRGIDYKEGFIINLVKPLKKYNHENIDKVLVLIMLLLLSISLYRVYLR